VPAVATYWRKTDQVRHSPLFDQYFSNFSCATPKGTSPFHSQACFQPVAYSLYGEWRKGYFLFHCVNHNNKY